MTDHDVWLAQYSRSYEDMWCETPGCEHHTDPVTVLYERENGIGTITPEKCPKCWGHLSFDRPPDAA